MGRRKLFLHYCGRKQKSVLRRTWRRVTEMLRFRKGRLVGRHVTFEKEGTAQLCQWELLSESSRVSCNTAACTLSPTLLHSSVRRRSSRSFALENCTRSASMAQICGVQYFKRQVRRCCATVYSTVQTETELWTWRLKVRRWFIGLPSFVSSFCWRCTAIHGDGDGIDFLLRVFSWIKSPPLPLGAAPYGGHIPCVLDH